MRRETGPASIGRTDEIEPRNEHQHPKEIFFKVVGRLRSVSVHFKVISRLRSVSVHSWIVFRIRATKFPEFHCDNHQDEKPEAFPAQPTQENGKASDRGRNPSASSGFHTFFPEITDDGKYAEHPAPCVSIPKTRRAPFYTPRQRCQKERSNCCEGDTVDASKEETQHTESECETDSGDIDLNVIKCEFWRHPTDGFVGVGDGVGVEWKYLSVISAVWQPTVHIACGEDSVLGNLLCL